MLHQPWAAARSPGLCLTHCFSVPTKATLDQQTSKTDLPTPPSLSLARMRVLGGQCPAAALAPSGVGGCAPALPENSPSPLTARGGLRHPRLARTSSSPCPLMSPGTVGSLKDGCPPPVCDVQLAQGLECDSSCQPPQPGTRDGWLASPSRARHTPPRAAGMRLALLQAPSLPNAQVRDVHLAPLLSKPLGSGPTCAEPAPRLFGSCTGQR